MCYMFQNKAVGNSEWTSTEDWCYMWQHGDGHLGVMHFNTLEQSDPVHFSRKALECDIKQHHMLSFVLPLAVINFLEEVV